MKNNVCFFCGDISRGGGTEKISSVISSNLYKLGKYEIFIIDVSNSNRKKPYFSFEKNIKIVHIDSSKNIIGKMVELFSFLRNNKIKILINVDIMLAIFSLIPCKLLNVKIVSWEQFNYYNDIGSRNTKFIRQLCLLFTNYYINLTEQDVNTFKRNYRIKIPIKHIYNPIVKEERYEYDLKSKYLITAGNFYIDKGYDYCVRIGDKLFEKHPDWRWIFCGDGPEFDNIKSLVKTSKYKENFVIKGRINNLNDELKKSSIYVSCSKTEGFGLVLIEAQNNGLPVVAFDVPFGPSEIILENKNGYLIRDLNEEIMLKKIIHLIENESVRKSFSDFAHENFSKFKIEKIIAEWEDVFDSLLK